MKKILTAICFILSVPAFAQELTEAQKAALDAANAANAAKDVPQAVQKPNYWKNSLKVDLGFNQTALVNWAAGGSNNISLAANLDAKADYLRDLISWTNRLQMDFGLMWVKDNRTPFQKTNDRLYLESKWGRRISEASKWNYSASLDFRTQFTDGFDYSKGETDEHGVWHDKRISSIMSPGYLNLALGMEWKPVDWFNMNIAPITGGVIVCTDNGPDGLRAKYGMPKVVIDDQNFFYRPALFQFGAQLKANAKASVNDKFLFETQLVMFYDYLFNYKNPAYCSNFPVRVNWDNKISWSISKLFKIGLDTWLVFDPLVSFAKDASEPASHKVQFKEFLSINFTYTIANAK